MFDEEPKDIFEGTDKTPVAQGVTADRPSEAIDQAKRSTDQTIAPPPTRLPPTYGAMPPASLMDGPMPEVRQGGGGIKVVLIVVGILVILGVSGFFAYRIMVQPAVDGSVVDAVPDTGVITETPTTTTTTPEPEPEPTTQAPVETTNPASLLDSDGDGLTNARELEVGTSVTKADTDGDGLGDREEVEVYGTDPRKPDTDGDGFLDGQEVSGGYNPNGEGKLFTVPQGS